MIKVLLDILLCQSLAEETEFIQITAECLTVCRCLASLSVSHDTENGTRTGAVYNMSGLLNLLYLAVASYKYGQLLGILLVYE